MVDALFACVLILAVVAMIFGLRWHAAEMECERLLRRLGRTKSEIDQFRDRFGRLVPDEPGESVWDDEA